MAGQDELPIKIVVIPPSSAQVTRAMADIEAKVKASGRRVGQAMTPDTTKMRAAQERFAAEFMRINKAQTQAFAQSKRMETSLAKKALQQQVKDAKAAAAKIAQATFEKSPEGIFKAVGIKSPARRIAEIKNLKLAQKELNRELARGTITRLQYNTILKDTHKKMNLLERGDVRARGTLHRLTAQLASTTFEITGAVFGLTALGAALGSPAILGVKFLRTLEDTKLGISGILLAMGSVNGQLLTFGQASAAAGEQVDLLAQDAIRLAGTLEDFTRSFQAVLAPGLAAGMTISEIRKISVAGTVAVKTIGLDSRQIVQEIRDLVAGGIQAASSTLATSLGLTDKDIKAAKLSTEGLFVFLSRKLEGFYLAGLERSKTLSGKIEQTYEVFIRGLAQASEPVFNTLKGFFDDIADRIAIIDEISGTVTFKPEFIDSVKLYISGLNTVLQALLAVVKAIWDFKNALIALVVIKVATKLWKPMIEGAKLYTAMLSTVIKAEIGLMAVQEAHVVAMRKNAGVVAGGGILGSVVGDITSIKKTLSKFFSLGLIGIIKGAGKLIFSILGKGGFIGLALWGIYEGATALWEAYRTPLDKAKEEIQKSTKEITAGIIGGQKARAAALSKQIKGLEKALENVLDAKVNSAPIEAALKRLREEYAETASVIAGLEEGALSFSDRIQRRNAALINARKSIEALGGGYLKAANDVEKSVQAFKSLEDLKLAESTFIKTGSTPGKLKEFNKQVTDFAREKGKLEDIIRLNRELSQLEFKVISAPSGSKSMAEAADALAIKKKIIPLLGAEKELESTLNTLRSQDEPNKVLIEYVQLLLKLNKASKEQVSNIDSVTQKQKEWDEQLKSISDTSDKYVRSLRNIVEQKELELKFVGDDRELEKSKALIKHREKVLEIEIKYRKLLAKKGVEDFVGRERLFLRREEDIRKASEALKDFNRDMDALNEKEREAATGAKNFFKQYVSDAGNAAKLTTDYLNNVMSSLNSGLSEYFQTGKSSFEDFKNAVSKGLADIAAQMVTAGIAQAGIAAFTGAFGGGGEPGAASTFTDFEGPFAGTDIVNAKGNAFDPSGLVAFAKGGIVNTPTTFPFAKGTGLMGEAGPEAILPLSRTTSGDLGVKVSGGATGSVTNQVNVEVNVASDGTTDTTTTGSNVDGKAFGNALGQVVQAEILKQMRSGGLLAR